MREVIIQEIVKQKHILVIVKVVHIKRNLLTLYHVVSSVDAKTSKLFFLPNFPVGLKHQKTTNFLRSNYASTAAQEMENIFDL